VSRFVLACELA